MSPSVGPFVALSQVKSFTLARNPYHLCPPVSNDFECEALPGSTVAPLRDGVIPVDLLVIDLRGLPSLADEPLRKAYGRVDTRYVLNRWDVLALFDPKELRVLGDPSPSRVPAFPWARKALDAYRISAGDCHPGVAHAVDLLPWGRLEHVLFVNTVCHNLAYLKVPTSGQKRVNVIVDLSRQDLVQMPDSSFRWSKEPRTPVSEAAQHSAVTSALSTIKSELRAERVDGKSENRHQPPHKRWLNASLLGHVTILVANEEQVQEAEELISWHYRTNVSQRSTAEFFNLIQSKTVQCVPIFAPRYRDCADVFFLACPQPGPRRCVGMYDFGCQDWPVSRIIVCGTQIYKLKSSLSLSQRRDSSSSSIISERPYCLISPCLVDFPLDYVFLCYNTSIRCTNG